MTLDMLEGQENEEHIEHINEIERNYDSKRLDKTIKENATNKRGIFF